MCKFHSYLPLSRSIVFFPTELNAACISRSGQLTLSCHVAFKRRGGENLWITTWISLWTKTNSVVVSTWCVCPVHTSGMAWTKYQLFLAGLMLVTGSINTLSAKWVESIMFSYWCHVFIINFSVGESLCAKTEFDQCVIKTYEWSLPVVLVSQIFR